MLKQFCKIFVFQLNSQRVDSQSDYFNFNVDKKLAGNLPDGRNMEKKFVPTEVGSEKLSVEGRISQAGGRGKTDLPASS